MAVANSGGIILEQGMCHSWLIRPSLHLNVFHYQKFLTQRIRIFSPLEKNLMVTVYVNYTLKIATDKNIGLALHFIYSQLF